MFLIDTTDDDRQSEEPTKSDNDFIDNTPQPVDEASADSEDGLVNALLKVITDYKRGKRKSTFTSKPPAKKKKKTTQEITR